MKSILKKHEELQKLMVLKGKQNFPIEHESTVKETAEFFWSTLRHLSDEVQELTEELIHPPSKLISKPWKSGYKEAVQETYVSTQYVKEEAIDTLCFCLNILIGAGITSDTIDDEYNKIHDKIMSRIESNY